MNKIIYDIELEPIQQNKITWNYYYKYIKQIKNKKDKVKLGLYCAKYCFEYNNEFTKPLAQKCIELIEKHLIDPKSITQQELLNAYYDVSSAANYVAFNAYYASATAKCNSVTATSFSNSWIAHDAANCLSYCSQIPNINMNLPHQYLQTLLRSTKQFNIQNHYSKTIEQIIKQDVDKLELVDYNMLLDISNEYYNIDISDFNYDNFSAEEI